MDKLSRELQAIRGIVIILAMLIISASMIINIGEFVKWFLT